jgi:hypothetical protein
MSSFIILVSTDVHASSSFSISNDEELFCRDPSISLFSSRLENGEIFLASAIGVQSVEEIERVSASLCPSCESGLLKISSASKNSSVEPTSTSSPQSSSSSPSSSDAISVDASDSASNSEKSTWFRHALTININQFDNKLPHTCK